MHGDHRTWWINHGMKSYRVDIHVDVPGGLGVHLVPPKHCTVHKVWGHGCP